MQVSSLPIFLFEYDNGKCKKKFKTFQFSCTFHDLCNKAIITDTIDFQNKYYRNKELEIIVIKNINDYDTKNDPLGICADDSNQKLNSIFNESFFADKIWPKVIVFSFSRLLVQKNPATQVIGINNDNINSSTNGSINDNNNSDINIDVSIVQLNISSTTTTNIIIKTEKNNTTSNSSSSDNSTIYNDLKVELHFEDRENIRRIFNCNMSKIHVDLPPEIINEKRMKIQKKKQ